MLALHYETWLVYTGRVQILGQSDRGTLRPCDIRPLLMRILIVVHQEKYMFPAMLDAFTSKQWKQWVLVYTICFKAISLGFEIV